MTEGESRMVLPNQVAGRSSVPFIERQQDTPEPCMGPPGIATSRGSSCAPVKEAPDRCVETSFWQSSFIPNSKIHGALCDHRSLWCHCR
jgi:hypothetical protein